MERYNVNEIKAKELIADNDYTRELFTKTFTGCNWYDARNYDLALDVKNFGVQGAVEFLLNFIG
ncbi:cytidylate kinase [Segatella baroniae B14]|uniref:Cytidylate kinase n=2 Tax=Segatella TaxID=2974251 RepID=D8DYS4_9BACT|nr:cytidylate kinase [Segatella baroniae B14]